HFAWLLHIICRTKPMYRAWCLLFIR
ncbi:diguanylate cyclase/phosphodiesterase 2 domain protein, partial [Vibrio parahaemolyticus EKP-028]